MDTSTKPERSAICTLPRWLGCPYRANIRTIDEGTVNGMSPSYHSCLTDRYPSEAPKRAQRPKSRFQSTFSDATMYERTRWRSVSFPSFAGACTKFITMMLGGSGLLLCLTPKPLVLNQTLSLCVPTAFSVSETSRPRRAACSPPPGHPVIPEPYGRGCVEPLSGR